MNLELTPLQATFILSLIHESIDKNVPTEDDGTILVPTWIVDLLTNIAKLVGKEEVFEEAPKSKIILTH